MTDGIQDKRIAIVNSKTSKPVTEDKVELALLEAEYMINNHCNTKTVPSQLTFEVINIAVDIIEAEYIKQDEKEEIVTSIKEGDTTISFVNQEHKNTKKDMILDSYVKKLNKFRKLRR